MDTEPVKSLANQIPVFSMLEYLSRFTHLQTCFILVRDDFSELYPLLQTSLGLIGGTFLNLSVSDEQLPDSIPAKIPDDKLEVISDFSKQLHIADTASKETVFYRFQKFGDGNVNVKLIIEENQETYEGKPLQGQSMDRASVLATILMSPVASIYEGYNTIGLIYDPGPLDSTNKNKLHEYFCDIIGSDFPNINLIVFLRTRNLDEALFLPPINLVGALEANDFIKIMPASETNNNIRQCAGKIKKENPTVFFLGAGSSSEADIPTGQELCRIALEQLLGKSREDPYEELEKEFWEHVAVNDRWLSEEKEKLPPLTFERVIREQIKQHGRAATPVIEDLSQICQKRSPSAGHAEVVEILKKGYRILIITTNYDALIEQAIESQGLKSAVIVDEETADKHNELIQAYLQGNTDVIPVIKLHGTIDLPITISASVEDTTILLGKVDEILSMILSKQKHQDIGLPERIPVVFTGYAFRDIDISKVFERKDVREGMDNWIVDPLPRRVITDFLGSDTSRRELVPSTRILSTRFGLFMSELNRHLP